MLIWTNAHFLVLLRRGYLFDLDWWNKVSSDASTQCPFLGHFISHGGLTGVRMSLELKGWYRYPNKSYDGAKTEIPAGQTKERVRQPWCSGLHQEKLCESKALEGEKAERLLKVTEEGGDRWWEQRTEAETKGHQMLEIAELWKQLRFGFKHWCILQCNITNSKNMILLLSIEYF